MSRIGIAVFAATTIGVCGEVEDAHAARLYTGMRISIHANATPFPSAATLNAAFATANTALQVDNGSFDQSCDLALSMADYWWFGGGTENVATDNDYLAAQFNSAGGYAVIVETLSTCQGVAGIWGGCGTVENASDPFLITRRLITAPAGGVAIAHEYGHTLGILTTTTTQGK